MQIRKEKDEANTVDDAARTARTGRARTQRDITQVSRGDIK